MTAAVCAVSLIGAAASLPGMQEVKAGQLLEETSFDYKALPWHIAYSKPAKQDFELTDDGTFHIKIKKAEGADREKWDLQFRYRNLYFEAGHKYEISFRVKAKREGMELSSKISNFKGDEWYCVLDGDKMCNGPHAGGDTWGKPAILTTEWQTITGEFTPDKALEACEWSFHYAMGTNYEGGNAVDGDELWFDDMSLLDTTGSGCGGAPNHYGMINREYSGVKNNYILVNQVGYFQDRRKTAVFSDNAGDFDYEDYPYSDYWYNPPKITGPVKFEVVDANTETVVYSAYSSAPVSDPDSGDTVCKLDFSNLSTPGKYYIRIKSRNKGDYIIYRSFDFEIGNYIYTQEEHDLFTDAMNYFYQNRSGIDIEKKYITSGDKSWLAHKGGHKTDTALVQKIWKNEYCEKNEAEKTASSEITATGGWYEAGTHSKNMVNSGMAVWTLQNFYEMQKLQGSDAFEDGSGKVIIPENGNKIPDILDEAAYEIDWMSQMKINSDDAEWGEKAAGLYSHRICDNKWIGLATKPWDYMKEWGTERIAKPPTFAATLSFAACSAQAARLWYDYDVKKAEQYLKYAEEAYDAYLEAYYRSDHARATHPEFGTECAEEELREDSLYAPVYQNETGRNYGDYDVSDDAYLAACELFVSTKVMGKGFSGYYLSELQKYNDAYRVYPRMNPKDDKGGSLTSFNPVNRAAAGSLTLMLHSDLLEEEERDKLFDSITETADTYVKEEIVQGYGIPYKYDGDSWNSPEYLDPEIMIRGYERDSNGAVLNNALIMAYAYEITGDSTYLDGITGAMDYLLGTNPLSFSYVSRYGQYSLYNPHHRYWAKELDRELPAAPDGVITGGPNSGLEDMCVRHLGYVPGSEKNPPQRCYVDSVEAWSVNTPSLELNASLAWVAGYLQSKYALFPDPEPTPSPSPAPEKSPEPTATPSEDPYTFAEYIPGDVTCDGIVDVTDLTTIAVALVERRYFSSTPEKNADVDHDGEVTLADLARIRQYLSKKIDSLE